MKIKILVLLIIIILVIPISAFGVSRVAGGFISVPGSFVLKVLFIGSGSGVVSFLPVPLAGGNCTSDCERTFLSGEIVTLTGTPDPSMTFDGWSGEGCSGTGDCVVTMNMNRVVTANFGTIPHPECLIGWYKHDEGSGATVLNYATDGSSGGGVLPNLTVYNESGVFWSTYVGFGSTPSSAAFNITEYAAAGFAARNISGTNAIGGFTYMKVDPSWTRNVHYVANISGAGNDKLSMSTFWPTFGSKNTKWRFEITRNVSVSSDNYDDKTTGAWYFVFIPDDNQMRVIFPNGTMGPLGALIGSPGFNNAVEVQSGVNAGLGVARGDYGCECSYGDLFYYNGCALTVVEWAAWYDLLRTRYGMAARSGW